MAEVTIRELRNHGGDVVDRVARGERLTVTRAGKPVAELRPISRQPLPIEQLIERRRTLPPIDVDELRRDLDDVLDATV